LIRFCGVSSVIDLKREFYSNGQGVNLCTHINDLYCISCGKRSLSYQ